ncbi:MAG: META domain-containing protein [Bacteroidales bacterium]
MNRILALLAITAFTSTVSATEFCNKAIDKSIGGEWIITGCNNKAITTDSEEIPFLNFNLSDSIIYGNNSCNVINGRFSTEDNQYISIENLISTMMYCHNAPQESIIMQSLNSITQYDIAEIDGNDYLNLRDNSGEILLTLKRHDMTFLNGKWRVAEINGSEVELNDAQLVIDTDQKSLHGNTGCNIVNGTIEINRGKDNSIQFTQLMSTRIYCPNIQFETELLLALESAETATVGETPEQIIFFNAENEPILTLTREMVCRSADLSGSSKN